MPSWCEHLSWESLWHKPKQMLIAEPYAASVHWPWTPWPEASPHTLPMAQGPHFSPASGTSPALRDAGGIPVPKLLFELWFWIGLEAGWWPLGCHVTQHCWLTPRDPSGQACFSTGVHDKSIWAFFVSGPHSHFVFFEWSDFRNSYELTYFSTQLRCSNCASLRSVWVPAQKAAQKAFPFCSWKSCVLLTTVSYLIHEHHQLS